MPSYTVDMFSFAAGVLFGIVLFMACVGVLRSIGGGS